MTLKEKNDGKPGLSRLAEMAARLNGVLCESMLVALVLIVALEVFLRNVFGISLQIMEEVSSYLLVLITFLAFSVSLREGALFRVDFVWERLPVRLRQLLQVCLDLLSIVVVCILLHATSMHVWSSYSRGMISPTQLSLPLWIPQLAMPLGLIFVLLVLAAGVGESFQFLAMRRNKRNGRLPPGEEP